MSYAAGIGDSLPMYMDTSSVPAQQRPTFDHHKRGMQGGGVMAHPLFIWAVEWPISWNEMGEFYKPALTAEEAGRAVHFTEDIIIHRPIMAGMTLLTQTQLVSVQKKSKGTLSVVRFDHVDEASGELMLTTWNGGYHTGVEIEGPSKSAGQRLPPPIPAPQAGNQSTAPLRSFELPISVGEAHIYTECSRIWNPIHTDRAAALAAGLPDIILHGTATLAKAVSVLVEAYACADPSRVRRVAAAAFAAVVLMPSTVTVQVLAVEDNRIYFQVLNQEGQQAVRGGYLEITSAEARL